MIVGMPAGQSRCTCDPMQPCTALHTNSHLAIKQSIIPWTSSILFWMEKLMKFVSTSMRNGGPRSLLCDRKSDEDAWALSS